MRILGLDPGLRTTGWGVVEVDGARIRHVANGRIVPDAGAPVPARLVAIFEGLEEVLSRHRPQSAAVEETFVNANPSSTLRLGFARGVALLAPARLGIEVAEYATTVVKKSVVGTGRADKEQVQAMVQRLLPGVRLDGADAADALAVALCHGHHVQTRGRWAAAQAVAP
jgi:crossover junction endodeoxyribonuclease RuvC